MTTRGPVQAHDNPPSRRDGTWPGMSQGCHTQPRNVTPCPPSESVHAPALRCRYTHPSHCTPSRVQVPHPLNVRCACTEADIGSEYTKCDPDTGYQRLVHYFVNSCDPSNMPLPPPKEMLCNISCPSGEFLAPPHADCTPCPAGTYSVKVSCRRRLCQGTPDFRLEVGKGGNRAPCPKHAGVGVGGTPKGRSSTYEQRDHWPTLTLSLRTSAGNFPRKLRPVRTPELPRGTPTEHLSPSPPWPQAPNTPAFLYGMVWYGTGVVWYGMVQVWYGYGTVCGVVCRRHCYQ